jgi:PTS system mannose-specific IIA component
MACSGQGRRIIYGANLPLLIKLAKSRDLPVDEAVSVALEAGRKYLNAMTIDGTE